MLTKSQQLLVDSDARVTLLIGGYGAGKTYAIAQKAILNKGSITIVVMDSSFIPIVKSYIQEIEYGKHSNISIIPYSDLHKIEYQDLILLDNLDCFPYAKSFKLYNYAIVASNRLIISSSPNSEFPLKESIIYQIYQEPYCSTIKMNLEDNTNLPEDYCKNLQKLFTKEQYSFIRDGIIHYAE